MFMESLKWDLMQGGEIESTYKVKEKKKSSSRWAEPSLIGGPKGRQPAPRQRRQQPPLSPHSTSALGDKQRRTNRFSHQSEATSFSSQDADLLWRAAAAEAAAAAALISSESAPELTFCISSK